MLCHLPILEFARKLMLRSLLDIPSGYSFNINWVNIQRLKQPPAINNEMQWAGVDDNTICNLFYSLRKVNNKYINLQ